MPRLTFKKIHLRGNSRGCTGFDLRYGGIEYAHIRPLESGQWYWYGLGKNTAQQPSLNHRAAQQECLAHARQKLAELKERFKDVSMAQE
jgi:hypothetical protein